MVVIHFYDSASPQNVPSGVYAAVYVNGFAWDAEEIHRMRRIIRISVEQSRAWARHARCIDVETGAADPSHAVAFVQERQRLGFNDATVYVNRSNYDVVQELIERAHIPHPYYWVATLDGTQNVEGAWAVQYQGGATSPFDVSILRGVNNFVRP